MKLTDTLYKHAQSVALLTFKHAQIVTESFYKNTQCVVNDSSPVTTSGTVSANRKIEDIVVSKVDTHDRQIELISEIVLALADKAEIKPKEFDQLSEAMKNVAKIKKAINPGARSKATDAKGQKQIAGANPVLARKKSRK